MEKLICDKCGSENVEVTTPKPQVNKIKMSEIEEARKIVAVLPYILTPYTATCKDCGFSVTWSE